MIVKELLQDPEQRDEVIAFRPPMHERAKAAAVLRRIEGADERSRPVAEDLADGVDRCHDGRDAPEREPGGDERDDFAVVERPIAADDLNRIDGRVGVVERLVQPVERRFQTCKGTQVCALSPQRPTRKFMSRDFRDLEG
jgi:hypothetical protein